MTETSRIVNHVSVEEMPPRNVRDSGFGMWAAKSTGKACSNQDFTLSKTIIELRLKRAPSVLWELLQSPIWME